MQTHRTEPRAFEAADPASTRLRQADVIEIHRAHTAGMPWDDIAARHNTNRKNVQRIVQGRRHRELHPQIAPELYASTPDRQEQESDPVAEIVNSALREARNRIVRELRDIA